MERKHLGKERNVFPGFPLFLACFLIAVSIIIKKVGKSNGEYLFFFAEKRRILSVYLLGKKDSSLRAE